MKKIMFNERFGLTQAVLEERKTMTRRIITDKETDKEYPLSPQNFVCPRYQIGEVLAVAQRYSELAKIDDYYNCEQAKRQAGWNNKMFVRADLMPHRIRITNIRVERLQDISEEDCLREGIKKMEEGMPYRFDENGKIHLSADPRMLFADLIDRISGRGTWQRNPWVFAYEFKLV